MDCENNVHDEDAGQRPTSKRKIFPAKCILLLTTISIAALVALLMVICKEYLTMFSQCDRDSGCVGSPDKKISIAPEAQELCKEVCTNPECINAASEFLSYMDVTVDPCEDFVSFSCGNRPKNSYLSNDKSTISHLALLVAQMFVKLLHTVETVDDKNPQSVSSKRKKLFDSCLEYSRGNDAGAADVRHWLAGVGIEDWPNMDEDWTPSPAEWNRILGAFLAVGENPFFDITVHVRGTPEVFREIDESRGLPFTAETENETVMIDFTMEYRCSIKEIQDYKNLSSSLLSLLGAAEHDADRVFDDFVEVYELIGNLSGNDGGENVDLNCSNPQNALNNRWCNFLLQQMESSNAHWNLSNSRIKLGSRMYFEHLDTIFSEYSPRKVVNFLSLSLILEVMENLRLFEKTENLLPTRYECEKINLPHPISAEQLCLHWLTENLHYIVTPDYIEQHDIVAYSDRATEIFERVRETAITMVENGTTLNEKQQPGLVAVFGEIMFRTKLFVNYFKEFDANRTFRTLDVSEKFISNLLTVKKFKIGDSIANPASTASINMKKTNYLRATAAAIESSISVMLGYLQSPLIGLQRPRYLDYGQLGSVIAHEFAHNVYSVLRLFEVKQWEPAVMCLAQQYSEYEIPELKIRSDGGFTLFENFADNLGFLVSYKAYLSYMREFGIEPALPGVPFSNEQMFFIYLSQVLCEFGDQEGYRDYITNPHSPAEQRIHGTLKNLKEFSEVFNCPKGSPMNPEKKCHFNF